MLHHPTCPPPPPSNLPPPPPSNLPPPPPSNLPPPPHPHPTCPPPPPSKEPQLIQKLLLMNEIERYVWRGNLNKKILSSQMGFEATTVRTLVVCSNYWATGNLSGEQWSMWARWHNYRIARSHYVDGHTIFNCISQLCKYSLIVSLYIYIWVQ